MEVTLESVRSEATKLGLELSDDEANAYVLLKKLPTKENVKPPEEEDDDEEEDGDPSLSEGMRKRINKLNAKHRKKTSELINQMSEVTKKLKAYETEKAEAERKKKEAEGKHQEVAEQVLKEKAELENKLVTQRQALQSNYTKSEIKAKLLGTGCNSDRVEKALQLIDQDGINFTWTNEDTYEYAIDGIDSSIEGFKSKWPEFFNESDEEQTRNFNGSPRPPKSKKKGKEDEEERRKEMSKKFPVLNRLI